MLFNRMMMIVPSVAGGPFWIEYGYIAYTSFTKIDYSNDLVTAPLVGTTTRRLYSSGAGNSSYGYFGGGRVGFPASYFSLVERLDYSNDTAAAVAKGPLPAARHGMRVCSNSSYAYFNGGPVANSPAWAGYSNVYRMDYNNDTATAVAKGPLSQPVWWHGSTGNSSYGYVAGGYHNGPSGGKSSIQRINYSNDTATATIQSNLSVTYRGYAWGAAGNTDYAYIVGGYLYSTYIQRIDYSNDTAAALARANIAIGHDSPNGTTNASYGWFSGGGYYTKSHVDRIDYSNDTATASARAKLNPQRNATGATNNGPA